MDKLKKYANRFAIGFGIGIAVWAGMSVLGVAGLVTFAAGNPLTSTLYSGLFFGVIQAATSIVTDIFDAKKTENHMSAPKTAAHSKAQCRALHMDGPPQHCKSTHLERLEQQRHATPEHVCNERY